MKKKPGKQIVRDMNHFVKIVSDSNIPSIYWNNKQKWVSKSFILGMPIRTIINLISNNEFFV